MWTVGLTVEIKLRLNFKFLHRRVDGSESNLKGKKVIIIRNNEDNKPCGLPMCFYQFTDKNTSHNKQNRFIKNITQTAGINILKTCIL